MRLTVASTIIGAALGGYLGFVARLGDQLGDNHWIGAIGITTLCALAGFWVSGHMTTSDAATVPASVEDNPYPNIATDPTASAKTGEHVRQRSK